MSPEAPASLPPMPGQAILVIIGVFKLIKGTLLLGLGLVAIRLMHKDLGAVIDRWADYLHVDRDGEWVNWLVAHALILSPRRLLELGVGLFIYSGLFFVEGIGLVLRKHWAEYFTTICTGLFIPMELWEIFHRIEHHSKHYIATIYLTAINIGIVVFLIARLRREAQRRRQAQSGLGVK